MSRRPAAGLRHALALVALLALGCDSSKDSSSGAPTNKPSYGENKMPSAEQVTKKGGRAPGGTAAPPQQR